MIELTRSNDPVLISWLSARLDGAGIGYVVLDEHTSILEGSIGAIQRRVMVLGDDETEAREILSARPDLRHDPDDEEVMVPEGAVTSPTGK